MGVEQELGASGLARGAHYDRSHCSVTFGTNAWEVPQLHRLSFRKPSSIHVITPSRLRMRLGISAVAACAAAARCCRAKASSCCPPRQHKRPPCRRSRRHRAHMLGRSIGWGPRGVALIQSAPENAALHKSWLSRLYYRSFTEWLLFVRSPNSTSYHYHGTRVPYNGWTRGERGVQITTVWVSATMTQPITGYIPFSARAHVCVFLR